MTNKSVNVKKMTVVAVLCAISYLISCILPFKVSFLTFDLKDAIIAISALMYGPLAGLICSVIVPLIELITTSSTGVYGLIMNFLSSAAFSVTAGLVYKYKRSFSGAILAMCMSVLAVTSIMLLANLFVTPYYMGVPRGTVIGLIPSLLLPFNAIKSIINAALTLLIYKPITAAFGRLGLSKRRAYAEGSGLRSILLTVGCIIVAAAATAVFVIFLGGTVKF